jgi:hypothetical protein
MNRSPYDPRNLLERAKQWRAEAAAATLAEMRAYCLDEADRCERRVQRSRSTPVFREAADTRGVQTDGPVCHTDPGVTQADR